MCHARHTAYPFKCCFLLADFQCGAFLSRTIRDLIQINLGVLQNRATTWMPDRNDPLESR
jgi:hypothetical protein